LLFRRRQRIFDHLKPVEHKARPPAYDWSGEGVEDMFNLQTALGLNVPASLP
jgi:hypothetical protein